MASDFEAAASPPPTTPATLDHYLKLADAYLNARRNGQDFSLHDFLNGGMSNDVVGGGAVPAGLAAPAGVGQESVPAPVEAPQAEDTTQAFLQSQGIGVPGGGVMPSEVTGVPFKPMIDIPENASALEAAKAVGNFALQQAPDPLSQSPAELAAGAMPMTGIFAGEMAKTADKQMLKLARRMAKDGADKKEIWDKTGWFQGADKRWRFEIPDTEARLSKEASEKLDKADVGRMAWMHNAPRTIEHQALYDAYPELRYMNVEIEKGGGYPYNPSGAYRLRESGNADLALNAQNDKQALPIALHELQHAIQNKEGFAGGADATKMDWNDYLRHAGEVEARNVETRFKIAPHYDKLPHPLETQDIPLGQQIIKR